MIHHTADPTLYYIITYYISMDVSNSLLTMVAQKGRTM